MIRHVAVMVGFVVLCTVAFAGDAPSAAPKPTSDVVAEIERMEHELARAIVNKDVETVRRIEAPTYVHTDSHAKVDHRDDFIRGYQTGASPVRALKLEDLVVDVYGDAAVVRGVHTVEFETKEGSSREVSRYTRFYVRSPQGWQAVAGHSSVLKRPE